ncbi:MAG: beta-phosphoglucomutase family hydrolase [Thermodesulfobacteriota bacterium]
MGGQFKAAIFDLDGVVVDTVPLHFKAWKRMFGEYGKDFTLQDYKEKVDGIPRSDGARAVLTDLSTEELLDAMDKKQNYFLEYLDAGEVPVFETTVELMKGLISKGIKIAVISSSKNSPYILEKTGVIKLLDTQLSGHDTTKGKPHPQVFLMAAERLGMKPEECVVFEDAVLGVEAAKRAKMLCVGVDRHSDPRGLKAADTVVSDLGEVNYDRLLSLFEEG